MSAVATAGGKIVIPTPALAEFLVGLDEAAIEWINVLDKRRYVVIAPFDRRSAFEASILDKAALSLGDKRGGRVEPWQRIKIDRQIVAIAKVNQADMVVSDDAGLRNSAVSAGLRALAIHDLDLPESAKQQTLELVVVKPAAVKVERRRKP